MYRLDEAVTVWKESSVYGSHLSALVAALLATDGPVLELGCGFFSTPMLHAMCEHDGRRLVSIETSPEYFGTMLERYGSDGHELYYVHQHEPFALSSIPKLADVLVWAVVLVDQESYHQRALDIDYLADKAEYLVVHDAENPIGDNLFDDFSTCLWLQGYGIVPDTAVVSNLRNRQEKT